MVEGSLLKFVARNHWKSVHLTLNGTAFGWKNWYFSPKVCISFEIWLISSKQCLENVDFHENLFILFILVIFQTSTTNGGRLSFENCLKSVILVISWDQLISLESVHFMKIDNFPWRNCKRYKALFWNLLRSTEICNFTEICSFCWFSWNKSFSLKSTLFHAIIVNGKAPLKSDARNPLKMVILLANWK